MKTETRIKIWVGLQNVYDNVYVELYTAQKKIRLAMFLIKKSLTFVFVSVIADHSFSICDAHAQLAIFSRKYENISHRIKSHVEISIRLITRIRFCEDPSCKMMLIPIDNVR